MRLYAVYERHVETKTKGRSRNTPEDSYVLVKEGFCWPALFFGPLWAIANGMWVIFLLLIAAFAGIAVAPDLFGGGEFPFWLCCGFMGLLGLFGNDLRQWSLGRAGYELVSIVSGTDQIDAERRLFAAMNSMYG